MDALRTIYHVYDEEEGEVEGMFDAKGELLDTWCCNDASWRGEYFEGFMLALGIRVKHSNSETLKRKLRKVWAQ